MHLAINVTFTPTAGRPRTAVITIAVTLSATRRVANQERQRIERSEVIPSGQVSAARQVGREKQKKQVSETAKRAAMRPEGGYVDLNLTREGSGRMVFV